MRHFHQSLRLLICILSLLPATREAIAQSYPTRTVTIVVPFPAGGPTDILARILSESMRHSLGQPVVVENVSGAGGSVGVARVARAAPDGHMLSIGHWQTHVVNGATQSIQFDAVTDFEPVSLIADTPMWIVGRATLPAKDLAELIAWFKANPGKANVGIVGTGGGPDVVGTYFKNSTGTSFQFVPYRGGAPLVQDLLAGVVDLTFGQAAAQLEHERAGKLRAFAIMADRRWWAAPNVPTIDEAGVKGLYASFWHGIWAPKATPRDIVAKLNSAIVDALADTTVRKRFADIGQEIPPREKQNPQALAALQKAEIEKWWPIIKAAGIKAQ